MLIRSYSLPKDQSLKRVQSNIMASFNKKKSNENVLKTESSIGRQAQSSTNTASNYCRTWSKEEKESKIRNKESIKTDNSKLQCNNSPKRTVSLTKTSNASKMLPTGAHSLQTYDNFNQLRCNLPSQSYRSFSDTRVQYINSQITLSPNSKSNDYKKFHVSRSTEPTNSTQAALKDMQLASALRSWEAVSANKPRRSNSSVLFTIMNYNVLAQQLLTEHAYLYRNHHSKALGWEERWAALLKEIKQHKADILCLQEVQASHLDSYYSSLRQLGYDGVYKQRTGIRTDGCAIYYNVSELKLLEYHTVEFNQSQSSILDRDNVAIIARFSPKRNPKNEFVVATTHLLYNPRREDVRLAQTQVLLSEVDRISYKNGSSSNHSHLPIIISGDFNLKPNSAIYELLIQGNLQYEHLTQRFLSRTNTSVANTTGKVLLSPTLRITDECQHADIIEKRKDNYLNREDEVKLIQLQHTDRRPSTKCPKSKNKSIFSTGTLSHHLALKSAYNHMRNGDLEATTHQDEWITVDYIFYSGYKDHNNLIRDDKLKLLSRYTVPTRGQLQGVTIPNFAFGSDHFSLVAKFQLDP